jgi:hypothetical protein
MKNLLKFIRFPHAFPFVLHCPECSPEGSRFAVGFSFWIG